MKKKLLLVVIVNAVMFLSAKDSERVEKGQLKVSLIIPCYPKHAPHLYDLLKLYEKQTVLPDEVIVALSECHKIESSIIDELESENWLFSLKISKSEKQCYAGENRNRGCEQASGDIFILQDADDVPHPQRIEILKYFFEKYDADHIMHLFSVKRSPESKVCFEEVKDVAKVSFYQPRSAAEICSSIAHGNIAISKRVFEKIQWNTRPRQEDSDFNGQVYRYFKNLIILKFPLLIYRIFLSSSPADVINTR